MRAIRSAVSPHDARVAAWHGLIGWTAGHGETRDRMYCSGGKSHIVSPEGRKAGTNAEPLVHR